VLSNTPANDDSGTSPAGGRWSRQSSVGYLLNVTARSARAHLEQLLAEAGATFVMWTILANLAAEGGLIQRELAERLSIESPTLTRQLANLEALGLIERLRSSTDRRAAKVAMTPAGRAMYHRLEGVVLSGITQTLDGFSEDEVLLLHSMLSRIDQNLANARRRAVHGRPARPA
jgi:MarR family transcriptional regulator, transcriptional regulator for hemolysin